MQKSDHEAAARRLEQLEAEAQHARGRYELYRAKVYARKPSSPARLRELKRGCETAEGRLSRAQGALRAADDDTHERELVEESARIEAELKRNPNRADTRIARASGTTFTFVRAVRERLGLYPREGSIRSAASVPHPSREPTKRGQEGEEEDD
jgi:hypothetical protein